MTVKAGELRVAAALTGPLLLFFILFVAIPLLLLAGISLYANSQFYSLGLDQYAKLFGDPFSKGIIGRTLVLGFHTTWVSLLIGFPVAYIYTTIPKKWQGAMLFLIVLPLLTSAVVRSFAWIVILGRQGLLNQALLQTGVIGAPVDMLYTDWAVIIALAQVDMPLMVLPLIVALEKVDVGLIQASRALGASCWRTFVRITLPMCLPGIISGCILVFSVAVSAYVTQSLIGGGKRMYLPAYIFQQAINSQNWPFAAAIAVVMLVCVFAIVALFNMAGRWCRAYAFGA